MPKIEFEQAHQLSEEEARKRLEGLVTRFRDRYGLDSRWNGTVLEVSRKGVSGAVSFLAGRVRVKMDISLLLSPLAGAIEKGLRGEITSALA